MSNFKALTLIMTCLSPAIAQNITRRIDVAAKALRFLKQQTHDLYSTLPDGIAEHVFQKFVVGGLKYRPEFEGFVNSFQSHNIEGFVNSFQSHNNYDFPFAYADDQDSGNRGKYYHVRPPDDSSMPPVYLPALDRCATAESSDGNDPMPDLVSSSDSEDSDCPQYPRPS
eukprot:gene16203-22366_t